MRQRRPLILSVGSMYSPHDDRKGFAVLLDGFARFVQKEIPGARLVIIGRTFGLAARRWASSSRAMSSRDELRLWYAAADVFTLPSLGDNAPLAVLEAMASGAPVVATSVGGIPEQVGAGHDRPARAAARRAARSAPRSSASSATRRLRATMGAAGRARASASFGRDRAWAAHEALYRSLARPLDRRL